MQSEKLRRNGWDSSDFVLLLRDEAGAGGCDVTQHIASGSAAGVHKKLG